MKNPRFIKSLVAAALPIVSLAYGAETPVGSLSNVTFAFTLSKEAHGTVAKNSLTGKPLKKDENGFGPASSNQWTIDKGMNRTHTSEDVTKIVSSKYSVKEFLTDLTLGNPALISDIKGWSVQKLQVTTGSGVNLQLSSAAYYLVKKGADPIYLGDRIITGSDKKLSGINLKVVTTSTGAEAPATPPADEEEEETPEIIYTETGKTATYSEALKFVGGFAINLSAGKSVEAYGVYTGGQKLGATKTKQPVILSTAAKLTSLTGESSDDEIVEGSAAYGAGVAVDATPYILD